MMSGFKAFNQTVSVVSSLCGIRDSPAMWEVTLGWGWACVFL